MIPDVSVILPFFNAEKTLKTAAESILKQSFSNLELLLVDNNSSDISYAFAEELAKTDSRIRLLKKTKQGVAHAMHCGLQNARGNFIARMDADDISYPERLEKQLDFLLKNPEIDFVGSEVKYVPHNKNTAGFQRFVNWVNSFHTTYQIEQKLCGRCRFYTVGLRQNQQANKTPLIKLLKWAAFYQGKSKKSLVFAQVQSD